MRRDRGHRATALFLAAFLLPSSVTTGCSFMFVDGPKPGDGGMAGGQPSCTTSAAWPIVDMVLTGWFLVNAVLNANKPASDFGKDGESAKSATVALGVMLTGLAGVSSGVGFSRINACQESMADPIPWRPTRSPTRRFAPTPPPQPAPPPGQTPPPYPGAPGTVAPTPGVEPPAPGAVPVQPATPPVPAAPVGPPAPQMEDDEAPRPRAAPRSRLTLPATEPLLAAMPRLRTPSAEPARPTFEGLTRFAHPWELVLAQAR